MIPLDDVSTRIFGIVQSKGLEQKKFAELVGVTDKTVNNWKMGRSESYTKYIRKIAKVLDTTTEYLLTGDSPKQGNASYVSELDTLMMPASCTGIMVMLPAGRFPTAPAWAWMTIWP